MTNRDKFESFSFQELNAKADEIRSTINEIDKNASICANNYRECKLPSNLTNPLIQLPRRLNNSGNVGRNNKTGDVRVVDIP